MVQTDKRTGRILSGRYQLEERVSQELLGDVYAATDRSTGQRVQVKILHEHLSKDDRRFGRFLREVRAGSMVRHVNTIETLDSGTDDELHYLIFEYFEARSLEEELKAVGPLPIHRVAHIAAQIASAIGAAHQESVTHRALNPRNVLLLSDSPRGDFVKVRDFGLSKLERFSDEESNHLTEAGMRVGNTAYMAPEYIERDRFHPKGDLYALGCLMTIMLTGKPPFTGRGASVLTDHVASDPPRPSSRREDVPGWLDELVLELLEKRPEDRPGAYQIVQRLEEGIGHRLEPPGLGPEVRPVSSGTGDTAKKAAPRKEQRLPAAIVAIVALTLAGIAASMAVLLVVVVLFALSAVPEATPRAEDPVVPVTVPRPAPEPGPAPQPEERPVPSPVPAPAPAPAAPDDGLDEPNFVEQAERAELKVTCNRRALVLVDGTPRGMTPLVEPVFPGIHRVSVMLPGKPDTRQEKKISVKRGEQSWVVFAY